MERFLLKKPNANSVIPNPDLSSSASEINENSQGSEENFDESGVSNMKNKKRKGYTQHFKNSWKQQFIWAEPSEEQNVTRCNVCNITISGSVTHLKRHEDSTRHTQAFEAAKTTPSVKNMLKNDPEKTVDQEVREAELKLVMFLIEHNLPFRLMDHLPQLISSVCSDSKIAKKIQMKRKKATQLCTSVLGPSNEHEVVEDLKEHKFSLIVDETTDISVAKCLALIARYHKNNNICDRFLDLIEVEDSTAHGLFNAIKSVFIKHGIPFSNVIGFGADNCSVMMGNTGGLKALFQNLNPSIITIGCSCHSFNLCSSHACEKLPRSVEQFARDVYNYFSNSGKRCAELKECQIFADEKPHKMLKPNQVRWLSLQGVVNRILEHWPSLQLFFTRAALEDNIPIAQTILAALKTPVYKLYFYFLSYILEIINKLNIEFQAERPKIHVLLNRVTALYRTILKYFLKKDYVNSTPVENIMIGNPHYYLSLEEIYCGAKVNISLKDNAFDPQEINNYKIRILDFYIELAKQIKKRFNFNDPVLKFAANFDPDMILSGDIISISETANIFPFLDIDPETLDLECRLLCEFDQLKKKNNHDMIDFWASVDEIKK